MSGLANSEKTLKSVGSKSASLSIWLLVAIVAIAGTGCTSARQAAKSQIFSELIVGRWCVVVEGVDVNGTLTFLDDGTVEARRGGEVVGVGRWQYTKPFLNIQEASQSFTLTISAYDFSASPARIDYIDKDGYRCTLYKNYVPK